MTPHQAKTIACGLLHDGIRADQMSPKARSEVREALDMVLKLAGKTKRAPASSDVTGNDRSPPPSSSAEMEKKGSGANG